MNVSTMKSIAATLLCSLLLVSLVTADESHNDKRSLQVVLCRCEKKAESLYNRRLRGFDENHRNLGTFQDSQGYYIVDGIRVLPLDDEDCVVKKKRKANIFDNRQLRNVQDETDEQEMELNEEVTGGEGMEEDGDDIQSSVERQLKRAKSFICRETVFASRKSTNPIEAFINDITSRSREITQGSTFSNQAVQNLANSNADTIEAQTGVAINNNLADAISAATSANQAVQNLANSNADTIEAQTGVAIDNNLVDAISAATSANQAVQNLANSNADTIEAQTGVAIDNNLMDAISAATSTNQAYSTFNPANYQQYYTNANLFTAASFPNQEYTTTFATFLQGNNFNFGNLNVTNFQGSISTAPTMPALPVFTVDSNAESFVTGTGYFVGSANSFGFGFVTLNDGTTQTSISRSP